MSLHIDIFTGEPVHLDKSEPLLSKEIYCSSNTLFDFIEASQKTGNFATICSEDEAEFVVREGDANNEEMIYIRFCEYDKATADIIRAHADLWCLSTKGSEEWDLDIHPDKSGATESYCISIEDKQILVKDKAFVGVVGYTIEYSGSNRLVCALTQNYSGAPLLFRYENRFLSSDHDASCSLTYYLVKK